MENNNNGSQNNNNIKIEEKPEKNEIKNEIVDINSTDSGICDKKEKEKNKNKKYKIKFSVIIGELRHHSDETDRISLNEYTSNLLLMSSQINQTNKISCLTLLSYINYKRENALYTYYINKKIFKYLKIQKSIEPFTYIRTLYRAAYFLEKEKNFFYARKYVYEADNLSKSSKIDEKSTKMLNDIRSLINKEINNYLDVYITKFIDIENPENLNEEKYLKMKKIFKELNDNDYQKNRQLNINNQDDLYIIGKNWFTKANQFFLDYTKIRDNNIKNNYFKEVFEPNYCYLNYFDLYEELKNKSYKYSPFPCLIDNYSIINWTDNWLDPLNEDENYILKKDLKEDKDYYLLNKEDFELLQNFFGVTNVIKRKRIDLVEIKAIILDKRFIEKDNTFLLKKRSLQIRNDYKIIDLKEKIERCINYTLDNVQKEILNNPKMKKEKKIVEDKETEKKEKNKTEENNEKDNEEKKSEENKKKDNQIENENKENEENKENKEKDIKTENENEANKEKEKKEENNIEEKKEEIQEDDQDKSKGYEIRFYILEKEKKDILMEICVSFLNKLPKYESIYLKNIEISNDDSISKLLSSYNKSKDLLIIELHQKDSPFIIPIIPNNNIFTCQSCKKEITDLNQAYKCNICNYSLFCTEDCANNDPIHEKLNEIYIKEYLYEEFNLESFLKKDISELGMITPESNKGMAGLKNLGNTCYMNSTLQCLSNTFDLTKYFLLQYFRNDINTGNKLGSNGSVALRYYNLLCELWIGNEKRINPEPFINTFKGLKKQFAGRRQQDAQEFLSVLLDQLHEDLNRITDKPYIELLEKQQDEDDLTASKRWWDLHKKREDSIIIDLFNGQFKSETICQVCGKSSITYDPFLSLCVPLPKAKVHFIFKIFMEFECKYLEYQYTDKNTVSDLKKAAIDFISPFIKDKQYFDLELVLLDENKSIQKIISTDDTDKKNYMGKTELSKLLVNKSELVLFEKNTNLDDNNYTKFYIYPVENQVPDKISVYYNHATPLKYLSYPLFLQVKNDTTIQKFYNDVLRRIRNFNIINMDKYEYYFQNDQTKILDLSLIHGKDSKKEGFLSWFSIEDTCKYCGDSNETKYYCSITKLGSIKNTIKENFQKVKKPIILAAVSECYDKSGEGKIYLECPIFNSYNYSDTEFNGFTDNITLKDCLDLFISNENIQEDDSWYCKKCKQLQKSKQKLEIYKPPNYLIILIKRYNFEQNSKNTFSGGKNNTYVAYPTDNLDIKEYIVGPEKDKALYDLYGVIQHFGTLNQGHYTAICKNDGNWVLYNDSVIDIIKNPVTKNAYVLFYKMKNAEKEEPKIEGK